MISVYGKQNCLEHKDIILAFLAADELSVLSVLMLNSEVKGT